MFISWQPARLRLLVDGGYSLGAACFESRKIMEMNVAMAIPVVLGARQ